MKAYLVHRYKLLNCDKFNHMCLYIVFLHSANSAFHGIKIVQMAFGYLVIMRILCLIFSDSGNDVFRASRTNFGYDNKPHHCV